LTHLFTKNNFLYLITDRTIAGISHTQIVSTALATGVRTIQFREKHMNGKELYQEAVSIREIVRKYGATLIINDYVDIARAVDADGVHIGQEDMPVEEARKVLGKGKVIGVSTHSLAQAVRAEKAGADYIGFGPVFETSTKDAGGSKGIGGLRKIRKRIRIPVVAIGGITWENVSTVLEAGADACAIVSGILAGDMRTNVEKFMNAMKRQVIDQRQ
jgi:thiamine-phosphate pyrophosphorylase